MEVKKLVEILEDNEIDNYQLNNFQKGLRLFNINDFDKLISTYDLKAFKENHGIRAPYGWNQEVFTDYDGWRISSNINYHK